MATGDHGLLYTASPLQLRRDGPRPSVIPCLTWELKGGTKRRPDKLNVRGRRCCLAARSGSNCSCTRCWNSQACKFYLPSTVLWAQGSANMHTTVPGQPQHATTTGWHSMSRDQAQQDDLTRAHQRPVQGPNHPTDALLRSCCSVALPSHHASHSPTCGACGEAASLSDQPKTCPSCHALGAVIIKCLGAPTAISVDAAAD
jgi:hypothetical protein